jgi:Fic family protein
MVKQCIENIDTEGGSMRYKILSKLYYSEPEEYEKIYLSRLEGEETLHFPIAVNGFPAFLICTHEVLSLCSEIHRVDKQVLVLGKQLSDVSLAQYKATCLIEEVKRTNEIEGIASTRRDIRSILENGPTHKKNLRWLNGIVRLYKELETPIALQTPRDIRVIYDGLVSDEIARKGEESVLDGVLFRKDPVYVKNQHDRLIHTGLNPEEKIISAMDKAIEILQNTNIEQFLRICIFHYYFGYIHPFYDGNGRVARFITSKILAQNLNPLISYRLSLTLKNQQDKYYKAFNITNDGKNRGDLTPFVIMFLELLLASAMDLVEDLTSRIDKVKRYEEELKKGISFDVTGKRILNLLLQHSLFTEKGLSIEEIAAKLQLSDSTVRNRLAHFPSGIITVTKEGRRYVYDLNLEYFKEESQ